MKKMIFALSLLCATTSFASAGYMNADALIILNGSENAEQLIIKDDAAINIYDTLVKQGNKETEFVAETRVQGKNIGCTKFFVDQQLYNASCTLTVK